MVCGLENVESPEVMWRADTKTPRIDLSTEESIDSCHFFSSS
jgi:hypothetical protein